MRWLTTSRDIAVLLAESGMDYLKAQLYHFGDEARLMSAELFMLEEGDYDLTLFESNASHPPFDMQKIKLSQKNNRISFQLPAKICCTLSIQKSGP